MIVSGPRHEPNVWSVVLGASYGERMMRWRKKKQPERTVNVLIVYLTDEAHAKLVMWMVEDGIGEAELVARALALYEANR